MLDLRTTDSIRRHLGVPVVGYNTNQYTMGMRWFTEVANLEYRMQNLQPIEEANLTGNSIGFVRVTGQPQIGDTFTVQINNLPACTYTVTQVDISAQNQAPQSSTLFSIANNFSSKWNSLGYPMFAQGGPVLFRNYPDANPTFSEIAFTNQGSTPFQIKVSYSTVGSPGIFVMAYTQGVQTSYQFTFTAPDGISQVPVYGLVPLLDYLQMQILQAMDNYSFSEAGIVKQDPYETEKREGLYQYYKTILSDYMGVKIYPMGNKNGGLRIRKP